MKSRENTIHWVTSAWVFGLALWAEPISASVDIDFRGTHGFVLSIEGADAREFYESITRAGHCDLLEDYCLKYVASRKTGFEIACVDQIGRGEVSCQIFAQSKWVEISRTQGTFKFVISGEEAKHLHEYFKREDSNVTFWSAEDGRARLRSSSSSFGIMGKGFAPEPLSLYPFAR